MSRERNSFEDLGDMGSADEFPRGRRQTRGRDRSRKSSRRWAVITLALVCAVVLAGVIYYAVRFTLHNPRFRFASFHVQGNRYVPAAEIEEDFSADRNQSIFRVPLELRRHEIEQIPWVRSATVRRVLPNQVFVSVRERVPVAFLRQSHGISLVDDQGVILNVPKGASFRFPVVRGLSRREPAETRREKMQLYAALMQDFERGGLQSNDVISEVDLEDPEDARIVVSDGSGTVLLHLGAKNFLARYRIYLRRIGEWKQKFPNLRSVDLRYNGQVVIHSGPPQQLKARRRSHTGIHTHPSAL